MSDLLIKNMDLSEERHIIITKKGEVLRTDYRGISMPTDSFAVEVKPHGRLIDADELVGNISDTYCEECPKTKPIMCKACEYEDIMDDIENAPTVLEASDGE